MFRLVATLFISIVLFSCSSSPDQEKSSPKKEAKTQVKEKATTQKKAEPKEEKYPTLTNETVVDFMKEYGKKNPETLVRLETEYGNVKIRLYENTPIHRANFIYLTKRKYFDQTQFYRVAKEFVCQAGNSDDWETQYTRKDIGMYTLPAELPKENVHTYGAVAAARSYNDNPEKLSSPYEFYIIMGPTFNEPTMRIYGKEYNVEYSPEQIELYGTIGGQPSLDQQHTVFGEVIEGMDVIEEINKVEVDSREWPNKEIPIKVRIAE